MLQEWKQVRQRPEEGYRRWFRDEQFDLIVWYESDTIVGFQLCYDTDTNERAITWYASGSYVHTKVDDGERSFGAKGTPILVSDGVFDADRVAGEFRDAAAEMDDAIADLVCDRLVSYSD
ncbi:MAG: hypothetical protein V3S41_03865 [Spirochaetia bacterium]